MVNPPIEWSVQILAHDSPVWLAAGQMVAVDLRVKLACSSNRVYGVRLPLQVNARWFDQNDQPHRRAPDHPIRVPVIAFNQEFRLNATLAAPRTPGAYRVQWEFALGEAGAEIGLAPVGRAPFGTAIFVSAFPNATNNWRVESSVNSAEIARVLDGDAQTAWDSRTAQARGQWLRLDLTQARLLDGIQVIAPGNGFPRGYALNVSADGEGWTELARAPSNNVDDVSVAFEPQWVRYVQIDLLAASQTSWKVSEIRVHPAIEWRVTASHHAETADRAIDNRTETAWTAEAPQEPGMWFQLDLGREEWVSGLRLTAPGNAHPFAFRIAAWDAGRARWNLAYARTENYAAVDARFEPTRTQFINIQLIEPYAAPWAICHAHVEREMNDWLGPGG